ncbi:MAG: hypothetical protein J0H70_05205, partial [Microbacterium chocolatum]|nr:hypothetical protein [Microbacterium chocolatum]
MVVVLGHRPDVVQNGGDVQQFVVDVVDAVDARDGFLPETRAPADWSPFFRKRSSLPLHHRYRVLAR